MGEIEDGLVSARHPEVFIDHFGDLSATKESIFLLSLLLFQVDILLNVWVLEEFLQRCGDPLAKPTQTWTSSYLRHRCHPCLLQGLHYSSANPPFPSSALRCESAIARAFL